MKEFLTKEQRSYFVRMHKREQNGKIRDSPVKLIPSFLKSLAQLLIDRFSHITQMALAGEFI